MLRIPIGLFLLADLMAGTNQILQSTLEVLKLEKWSTTIFVLFMRAQTIRFFSFALTKYYWFDSLN